MTTTLSVNEAKANFSGMLSEVESGYSPGALPAYRRGGTFRRA